MGSSIGGSWALHFALAHPERVRNLVLIGVPAGTIPPQTDASVPPHPPKNPTTESTRALFQAGMVADVDRVPDEVLEEDMAAARIPGVSPGRAAMSEWFQRREFDSYSLRPGFGEDIAALAPNAHCEVVQDVGHLVWLDQPERCARLTVTFLKGAGCAIDRQ